MPITFISKSESETEDFAYNLAKENKIKFGDIIALYGDLGAGKTAFTRGLTKFFSPQSRVTSPTFSLVNQYNKILHFDMYRINSYEDLLSIGFYDYLEDSRENIIIIEWFDKIEETADFFDGNIIKINIEKLNGDGNGDERKIYVDFRD